MYGFAKFSQAPGAFLSRVKQLLRRRGTAFGNLPMDTVRTRLGKLDPALNSYVASDEVPARPLPPECVAAPPAVRSARTPIPRKYVDPEFANSSGIVAFDETADYWTNQERKGWCEVHLVIDGIATFELRNDLLTWTETRARPPKGIPGKPSLCSQPLPKGPFKNFSVRPITVRGTLEPAIGIGDDKAYTIRFSVNDDKKDGKDLPGAIAYAFRIEWERL